MESFLGLNLRTSVVGWVNIDLLINIALFICGITINEKTEGFKTTIYAFLIGPVLVCIPGDLVLGFVAYSDKWEVYKNVWQMFYMIIILFRIISWIFMTIVVIIILVLKSTKTKPKL